MPGAALPGSRLAVLAVGTRGDVQPLLALSIALQDSLLDCRITLVTHDAHRGWLQEPADQAGLQLHFLASPPARVWQQAAAAPAQAPKRKLDDDECSGGLAPTAWDREQHREELVAACEAALGCTVSTVEAGPAPIGPAGAPVGTQQAAAAAPIAGETDTGAGADTSRCLILFNLFALEGFHIAEALRVPCLAASPCLVPYAMPAAFQQRFQRAHPQLFERLQAADEQRQQPDEGSSVGWSHVRHWLWPLFTESWGAWRHHRLGLATVPYSTCNSDTPLPPPPPLLYGVSEAVVPRPGYWPAPVHMCGYWHSQRCFPTIQPQQHLRQQLPAVERALLFHQQQQVRVAPRQPPSESAAAAPAAEPEAMAAPAAAEDAAANAAAEAAAAEAEPAAPICVDFGGMGLMGLLPQPHQLAAVLEAAAQRLRRPMIVLTAGWQPLLEACRRLELQQPQQGALPWVLAVEQSVSHDVLLPRCAALLHHGGAGTVAAALRSGVPQLICPLHFDQQQWAERVAWLGCGAQVAPAALLQADGVGAPGATAAGQLQVGNGSSEEHQRQQVEQAAEALATALTALLHDGSIRQQCARMQQELAAEDGLAAAVQLVRQQLGQQQQQREEKQQAASPPAAAVEELELPGGLRILCPSPAEALFIHREIFQQDCYLAHGGISLPPGSTVVDVGANIGLFVLRLLLDAQLAPAVRQVYALEPLPPTAEVLEANVRMHGLADKVTVLHCGLHLRPGLLPLTYYPAMPGNSTARPGEKWAVQRPAMAASMGQAAADRCFQGASRVECPVTTLAQLARDQQLEQIDLLKVDVEGCELDVLQGMDASTWAITHQVVAEVHDVGDRLAAVQALLEGQGFAVRAEQQQEGPAGNWLVFARRTS